MVVLPDNDEPGWRHAQDVACKLHGVAREVRLVELPGLGSRLRKGGSDVSDWLDGGNTPEQLKELVRSAPVWKPQKVVSSPALPLLPLAELLLEPEEVTEWVVEEMLPSGGASLNVAKPKVGKSTLARTLALAVARGRPFLRRDVHQGTVIYLALEEKKSQLVKQFRALGATLEDPILVFAGVAPKEAVTLLREAIREHNPALVIVDTVQRLVRVADGNDYSGVTAALEPILGMARDSGAHLHLLHHAGKGERDVVDTAIGSTAWAGSVDTIMLMKRREEVRTLATVQRYGEDLPETVLVMDETGHIDAGGTRKDHDRKQAEKAILDYLEGTPGAEQQQIREAVEGFRTAVLHEALTELRRSGRVTREGTGKKGDPYRHFPVPIPGRGQEGGSCSQNNGNRNSSRTDADVSALGIPVPTPIENNGNRNLDMRPAEGAFDDLLHVPTTADVEDAA